MIAESIIQSIERMSVLELVELREEMSERWGVPLTVHQPVPSVAVVEFVAPEQTEFDLILTSYGPNKIAVIKAVREITSLGLKEAKDLVESVPVTVSTGHDHEWADVWSLKLREVGATVEVR